MKISKPRGTRDFLPEEITLRKHVENIMKQVVTHWDYHEIVTPIFEHLDLFTLKSGEGIIGEIYNFIDKGGRELSLRPELTAPAMRMYVNEMQSRALPLKLFYFENCFRYERPQKGRFREFWQFGVEVIGSESPHADAEVIALAEQLVTSAGIKGDIRVGHLGVIRHILRELEGEEQTTIMRFVDKKDDIGLEGYLDNINATIRLREHLHGLVSISGNNAIGKARGIVGDLPELDSFEMLLGLLDAYKVDYSVDFGIARGLDYYTGMVFEIYAEGLGAQNQVCGGGSYRLIKLFGGGDVPSTGFGIGFDRIMEICSLKPDPALKVVVVATEDTRLEAIDIATRMRKQVPVYFDIMDRNFRNQLSHANSIKADYVVIVGKKELESGKLTLKDMASGEQELVTMEKALEIITH